MTINHLLLLLSIKYAYGGDLAYDLGHFVQLTDIHFDKYYSVGSPNWSEESELGIPACRGYNVGKPPYAPAQYWGDHKCDAPGSLVDATIKWISKSYIPIDFILWTGDTVDHHDIAQSFGDNLYSVHIVTNILLKYFPTTPVIPVIGNHDTYPIDQFNSEMYIYQEMLKQMSNMWRPWISNIDFFSKYGFYKYGLNHMVDIIVINNLIWDNNNIVGMVSNDSTIQFNWLRQQLAMSSRIGKKVWLVGHISPGAGEGTDEYNDNMELLLADYSDIIKYSFFGHAHTDEFALYRNKDAEVFLAGFIAPSLVPLDKFSSFRIYSYNITTMEILDYDQYSLNLTQLNIDNNVNYTKLYSARTEYNLPDMSHHSWNTFATNMAKNADVFNKYYRNLRSGAPMESCDARCRQMIICDILYANSMRKYECQKFIDIRNLLKITTF
ncbi:MAG: hypothetical protein Faunusvirus5_27 [Faunusvirus sp.]|jgi:hypothetical protein|uniref:Uncharacterized protein n=1 Tax=Faunusvirus sp. TaxID=2487766 RepID=A0A3G4ZWD5_9VIRU|nr:MAG: hypothetical protein Faunusvirus5_27 [Faunusvirus sp.]